MKSAPSSGCFSNTNGLTTLKRPDRSFNRDQVTHTQQWEMADTGGQSQLIKHSSLTSPHFVFILDRRKDPFFTNTFHDSRGVPIPGPQGPPGPVGESLTHFIDMYELALYAYLHE